MTNRILRDNGLEQEFRDKGYVVVPALTDSDIETIKNRFYQLKPADQFRPANNHYHCTFLDTNETYKRECDEIFRTLVVPKFDKILHDFDLIIGNFYVKNSGGAGEFEIHQNWDSVDESKFTSVTVWIPLQDTNRENGTIEFVEGSHKLFPDIATQNADYYFKRFSQRLKSKYCKPCDMRAGEAVIFDDDLIHYSTANNSDQARVAIQLAFVPRVAQGVLYFLDPGNPKRGFEMYESTLDFFMSKNNFSDRPSELKLLGTVPNKNRLVSERQFLRRMKKGKEVREAFYEGKPYESSFIDRLLYAVGV